MNGDEYGPGYAPVEEPGRKRPAWGTPGSGAQDVAAVWKPPRTSPLGRVVMGGVAVVAVAGIVAAPAPAATTDSTASDTATADDGLTPELRAYFDAGYDWADAEELARLWNIADPEQAKAEAGQRLLAGRDLPIAP